MKRLLSRIRSAWRLLFFLGSLVLLVLASSVNRGSEAAVTLQGPEPLPTCPPHGCAYAWVPRYYEFQPPRYDMRPNFHDAAGNNLGPLGPSYLLINHGIPPVQEPVSINRPIPHVILGGAGWQESHWLQFADSVADPDNRFACTIIGHDPGGSCGFGLMQITTCMNSPVPPGCGWIDQDRVSRELIYNLGSGSNFFIEKWNGTPYIGDDDHTVVEQWYYAVLAYNSYGPVNDPNSTSFFPDRPPYAEANYLSFNYPYQEKVWGWMANPEEAEPDPRPVGWRWLWRRTRESNVPRGIFGLGGGWLPPSSTSKPVFTLIPNVYVANGVGPSIVLRNTDPSRTLAADVWFYNSNHTFNRWWLGAPPNPQHSYPYRHIRLAPNQTMILPVTDVFNPWETFNGYARVAASEGVQVTYQAPHRVYLPIVLKNSGELDCYEHISNGGFEEFSNGKPRYWTVFSNDAYPLAGGTWFESGHYAAYLGGRDYAVDNMYQSIAIPYWAYTADFSFSWYMRSEEVIQSVYDHLYVRLRNSSGGLVTTLYTITNLSTENTWQRVSIDLSPYIGQLLRLSFEADTDLSFPTSFFVDNVSIWYCTLGACEENPTPTPTPTHTPDPNTDTWTFDGEASDPGTGEPVPCTDTTLYHYEGNDWQRADSATTGSDGRFSLQYTGEPDPGQFLILIQYPFGYTPGLPQPGPHFAIAHNQALVSVGPIAAGNYGGHHFIGLHQPNSTPMPVTPTPPALPTIPVVGTPTPPPLPTIPIPTVWPSPTTISPLPTPTP